MNITAEVLTLLGTDDARIVGRIGSDRLFTDRCDCCDQPATVLMEVSTQYGRGIEREGYIYCLEHAREDGDGTAWITCDEIAVTIRASLLATDLAA
ncbi:MULTISPECIES: hypothetical protein [Nocardia]|uniref:hypothetical protein n=1 Tax=Nocardia TaxID=1817 RepID=UPI000D68E62F|nr:MULTISPECIES: hypothetical protein [Nocardia]